MLLPILRATRARVSLAARTPVARGLVLAALFGAAFGAATIAAPPQPQEQPTADLTAAAPKAVTLIVDGTTREVQTQAATIGDLLHEQRIAINNRDRCSAPPASPLSDGQHVIVTRITYRKEFERFPIRHAVRRRYSFDLRPGQTVVKVAGSDGMRLRKWGELRKDGVLTQRKVVGRAFVPPRTALVVVGAPRGSAQLASRGMTFTGRRVLNMVATGYYGPRCGGSGITAIGLRARHGIVAVDPRVIRLGSRLYIEGYGPALAGDTGGAIKGMRIDLAFNSYREAVRTGRKRVRVVVLN